MRGPRISTLSLDLAGPPRIAVTGAAAKQITGARPIALIAILACSPDMRCSRGRLIDLLWSDGAPERGRANLRQLLHALRQMIGEDFDDLFVIARDHVGLVPDRVDLRAASDGAEFLEGLDLGQEGFEDWLREERLQRSSTRQQMPLADGAILPRVAVLPFGEMHDGTWSGIGDAIAQATAGCFARSHLVDAISHFSSRNFDAYQIPDGCDFLMTGQCRVANGHLIVSPQLTEARSGRVLSSETLETSVAGFLAGQDELALQIAGLALSHIVAASVACGSVTPLPDLAAHTLMVSAVGLMHMFDRKHFARAEVQLQEVIDRSPAQSVPRAWLAQWHLLRVFQKWSEDPARDAAEGRKNLQVALDLHPQCPLSLAISGNLSTLIDTDFARADAQFDAAEALNPSSALILHLDSVLATFRGDGAKAAALTDRARSLSPRDPRKPFFHTLSAGSYVAGGRYEEAIALAEDSLKHHPFHLSAHRARVIALQLSGREEEARRAGRELMRLDPKMTVSDYRRSHPSARTGAVEPWAEALRQAGIPVN